MIYILWRVKPPRGMCFTFQSINDTDRTAEIPNVFVVHVIHVNVISMFFHNLSMFLQFPYVRAPARVLLAPPSRVS